MDKPRIVVRVTEEVLPEDPGALLTPGTKSVTFIQMMDDKEYLQFLGMLSKFMGAVSLWGTKMIVPQRAKEAVEADILENTPPPRKDMN